MTRAGAVLGWVALLWAVCAPTKAQIGRGDFRLSLDTDVLSVAGVEVDPEGPAGPVESTIIGVGPNQLGGSLGVGAATTPLGLGLGYAITSRVLLGLRLGLGLDLIDVEGQDDKVRVLALSMMPGLTFVPLGERAKLFITVSPIFQVNRQKQDDRKSRLLLGGFGAGLGTLIFAGSSVSADLGFFFEGRFGGYESDNGGGPDQEGEVRDLRGLVRFGLSLWK